VTTSKNEPFVPTLKQLPPASLYVVAYSGGVDSHVLLHWLAGQRDALAADLAAVHVDHQLQAQSAAWTAHCRAVCDALQISFSSLQIDASAAPGESPEAAARAARYAALADWLPDGAVLLTAQHRDDQAETVLLQLLRGAGPRGLAAMPVLAAFGRGVLVRPFLSLQRAQILEYARRQHLHWVEDPSNEDTRFDRNLLRHQVLPLLQSRWPAVGRVLARAADLQADQAELAGELARQDLRVCQRGDQADRLDCQALRRLAVSRQRNVLRHWIEGNAFPLPSRDVLEQLRSRVVEARADACPLLHWPGAELRRYRDTLYLMAPQAELDGRRRYAWDLAGPLCLAAAGGTLCATAVQGAGLRVPSGARVDIRFREGGERLQPAGRAGHHSLKHLFQEWAVPDWERARVPLIYAGDQLAAVAGLCICEGFQASGSETGYLLHWSRLDQSRD
jgi:tRNA(Ile)-lysidine synthase